MVSSFVDSSVYDVMLQINSDFNQFMVTTCLENLENLEMSGNLKHVREMSGMLLTVRELSGKCQGKNLVVEKCPKTGYCVPKHWHFLQKQCIATYIHSDFILRNH